MINKKKSLPLGLLLTGVFLAFCFVTGARAVPPNGPDIVFVRIPAAAEPQAPLLNSQIPSDRYVDGCQIMRLSLSETGEKPVLLTADFLSACDPAVSFDGQKILFAGKQKKGAPWQIWRMDANGGNKIQITRGNSDCVSPLYVGSLFHLDDKAPTRKIVFQGGNHLYTCDLDGKNPRRITYNLYPEFSPDVLPNGRIIFSSFTNNGFEASSGKTLDLLAVNIDGTDLMGYLTSLDVPGDKEMVRIGRDGRIYFIRSDLSQWLGGGALAYVSPRRPAHSFNILAPAENGFYHSPCPLPDGGLVVSHRGSKKGSVYALKIIKSFCGGSRGPAARGAYNGTRRRETDSDASTVYRVPQHGGLAAGGKYHCIDTQVLVPHPVVKGRSSFVDHNRDTGIFYCIDVYISDRPEMKNLPPGSIERVRVLEGFLKNGESTVSRRILGTAPVEPDGSFQIRVPAETPLSFQLLDKEGKVVADRHSWAWVMPRESRGCIGCHENRELAPPNQLPRALIKPAVKLPRMPGSIKKNDQ